MQSGDHRLAAIMFTDIVGFSAMMEKDEKATLQVLDAHNELVRAVVLEHRGTEIKTIGDAFLVQFSTTIDAVACSLAIQNRLQMLNSSGQTIQIALRIGVHVGDIYFYDNDAFGEGINIASRLQSLSKPGHITISREVYSQVSGKIAMRVESLGQVKLKNINREIHAFEIIPGGADNNSRVTSDSLTAGSPNETMSSPSKTTIPSPADFKDVLKNLILEEVQQSLDGRRHGHRARRLARAEARRLLAELTGAVPATRKENVENFVEYKEQNLTGVIKAREGWKAHLTSFLAVNVGLFSINWFTAPHPFLISNAWFLFPLLGWSIGIFSHGATFLAQKKNAKELQKITELDTDNLKNLKSYQRDRVSLAGHLWSNLAISALLGWIWVFTGTIFPWPLIPIAFLALGIGRHLASFKARRRAWKVACGGASVAQKPPAVSVGDPRVAKAETLKKAILEQLNGWKGTNPLGSDFRSNIENYVSQIGELTRIERQLDGIVRSVGTAELDREAKELRSKVASPTSENLRRAYEKSLSEVEQQIRSVHELAEHQEVLNLRVSSALKSLQQIQIDLARLQTLLPDQQQDFSQAIHTRSVELSRYLEDYRAGLEELA